MCDICGHSPCDTRCPNAPEKPHVFVCSGCGDSIREDDEYVDLFSEQYCMNCIEENKHIAEYQYEPDE